MQMKVISRQKLLMPGLFLLVMFVLSGCGQEPAGNQANEDEETDAEAADARIVVDSPAIAHYMAIFDVPLVGIPTTDRPLPEEYEGLPEIGIAVKPNIEKIVSLEPDLFIGDKVLAQFSKEQVESKGIETLYLDNSSYDSVFDSILEVGELLGKPEVAEEFIAEQRAEEEQLLAQAEALKGKKVALLMGTAESYQLATKNSYLGSILKKIGVDNVADEVGDTDQEYVTFTKESLVAANPDYILALAHGGDPEQVEASFKDEFASTIWDDTTAKQEDQIHYIDSEQYPVTGSVYNVQILEKIVNLLERGREDGNEQ